MHRQDMTITGLGDEVRMYQLAAQGMEIQEKREDHRDLFDKSTIHVVHDCQSKACRHLVSRFRALASPSKRPGKKSPAHQMAQTNNASTGKY